MATITGGVTGRPAGKLAGIVFGAARSRQGKVVTAREKVSPSNPDTGAQQAQRSKFSDSLEIVRAWGPSVYQEDWNRSVGQLPGFQSLLSILLNSMDATGTITAPPVTPLGELSDGNPVASNSTTGVSLEWGVTLTGKDTANDELVALFAPTTRADRVATPGLIKGYEGSEVRSVGAFDFAAQTRLVDQVVCAYFRGAGTAVGLLSPAKWQNYTGI